MMHGIGKLTWPNSTVYQGQFTFNQITGKGVYQWPDGAFYEGDVLNGRREGQGEFITPSNTAKYVGSWKHGFKHGFGKIEYASGSIYEGEF